MLRPKVKVRPSVQLPKVKLRYGVALLLVVLIAGFILYFIRPVLNLRFVGWIVPLVICLLPLLGWGRARRAVVVIIPLLLLWLVAGPFFSSGMFNSRRHRNLIGEVQKTGFSELVSPVNLDQVPIIDSSFAASLAEKKLGDDFALGSRVVLGTPTIQMVDAKLYWVVPLLHSGFFKWLTNRGNGTPGYIMVSATDPQDIKFIRQLNGRALKIRYQRSSYFGQDLYRHLYFHGYLGKGLAGDTFELDDQGEPYWTITTFTHAIGVNAPEATGLATVHAETGEIKFYPLKKLADGSFDDSLVPAWVDRVQPSYFVLPQLGWWGRYVHGWWNTVFGKRDMLQTTRGYNVIYGRDKRSYFYTGLGSVGSDESTVGFSLIDTRSKASHLYLLSGATETAAMRSAEGKVQNYGYNATYPILVNLGGKPTYFMTLKDSSGLVKMFSFVSVSDFSLVGVGESVSEARDNFQLSLANTRTGRIAGKQEDEVTLEGTVTRFGSDIKDGRAYYYLRLDSDPGKTFIATSSLSPLLPLTGSGDRLRVTYLKTPDQEISLTRVTNLSLGGE